MNEGHRAIAQLPAGWEIQVAHEAQASTVTVEGPGGLRASFRARTPLTREVVRELVDDAGHALKIEQLPPGWRLLVDDRVRDGIAVSLEVLGPRGQSVWWPAKAANVRRVLQCLAAGAGALPAPRAAFLG